MATCTITETAEKRVRLDMSEDEAKALRGVCGSTNVSRNAGEYMNEIRMALNGCGFGCPSVTSPWCPVGHLEFINPLPIKELPPLTLADIQPGEWFRHGKGSHVGSSDRPCLMAKFNEYLAFMHTDGPSSHSVGSWAREPVVRLTLAEARELARESGYCFPF